MYVEPARSTNTILPCLVCLKPSRPLPPSKSIRMVSRLERDHEQEQVQRRRVLTSRSTEPGGPHRRLFPTFRALALGRVQPPPPETPPTRQGRHTPHLCERLESLFRAVEPMRRFLYPSVTTVMTSSKVVHSTASRSLTTNVLAFASHRTAKMSFVKSSKSYTCRRTHACTYTPGDHGHGRGCAMAGGGSGAAISQ